MIPFENYIGQDPIEDLPEEAVSNRMPWTDTHGNDYFWNSGYDISFVDQTVCIVLNIALVGDDPGDDLRNQWEEGIEGIWSNSYDIVDEIYTYPIAVEVNWVVNADPHHVVTVHSGAGRANMRNWYTDRPGGWLNDYQDEIAAHEAGHMLSLYDEYRDDGVLDKDDGALDPNTLFTTTDSIMADLGPTRSWHYEHILDWLETRSGRNLSLAQSPLPPYPLDDPIPDFSDPMVTIVAIDIKPGSYPNSINLGSNGIIPVAILSSPDFDAMQVDPSTVSLSGAGVAIKGKGNTLAHQEDVNGDGLIDLVVQVQTENLNPAELQTGIAWLIGETYAGDSIAGSDEIVIVPPEAAPARPTEFALLQNFSNPFNPDTWIPYQLANDVDVLIRIYDAAGRIVRTLSLGHKPAGFYTIKDKAAYWDGRNEAGEQVASGVYFYTIQAGEFTATKKMTLAK